MLDAMAKSLKQVAKMLMNSSNLSIGQWEGTQFKAKADQIAHESLSKSLQHYFPGIPIISEEDPNSFSVSREGEHFLIDPLDGTASFAQGYSGWVTQVAFMQNSNPTFSAIYAPMLNMLWTAELGVGSFQNGEKMRLIEPESLTLIDNYPAPKGIADWLFVKFPFAKYVECGSLGLKTCMVASGKAHAFVKDVIIRDWDMAPAHLLLSQIGGVLFQLNGSPWNYHGSYDKHGLIACTQPHLAHNILSALSNYPRTINANSQ